jgi:K+-sensing histidine kinase KdpD
MEVPVDTYYAPPERTADKDLAAEIKIVSGNPIVTGLLHSISGLLSVLDEHRQVVALNSSFLDFLGIKDPSAALGLRPGEAIQCVHCHDEPAGCGTTRHCSTCGAAVAMVASLGQDKPVERICSLSVNKNGATFDLALLVRSHPIVIEQKKFLLLFLQDISVQEQRAALERLFFHDFNNMLTGLVGFSEQLALNDSNSSLANRLFQISLRMKKEVEMQRHLMLHGQFCYSPERYDVSPREVLEELKLFFANHPAASNKKIHFSDSLPSIAVASDLSLLLRVLCNMITNALEASGENGTVKVWVEQNSNMVSFCVWNGSSIPEDIALRVFQRNFSTKDGAGRGIGTYSMKLFGENILGGKVDFISSLQDGTTFRISIPS